MRLLIVFCVLCSMLSANENKKVALLFLTRSDLNHTELWKEWIARGNDRFNVYNHPKDPASDPWFSQFRIPENVPTKWESVIYALRALFREALKDPENYKFVLLTESCVPLRTPDEVYFTLCETDQSIMGWSQMWWNDNRRVIYRFPEKHRLGNQPWFILNRKHTTMFANDDYFAYIANESYIANEHYPASFLSMKGVLNEVKNTSTTFADWGRGPLLPYTFRDPTKENIDILLNARNTPQSPTDYRHYLFARKVAPEFPDEVLWMIINFQVNSP